MSVVSPILKRVIYPILSKSGYLRRAAVPGPVVVTYHGIFPPGYRGNSLALDGHLVTAEMFRKHVKLLKSRYNLITPNQFRAHLQGGDACPPHSVLLTCDDALLNVATQMIPITEELGVSLLLFATGLSTDDEPRMLWYEALYLLLQKGQKSTQLQVGDLPPVDISPGKPEQHWRLLISALSQFPADQRNQLLCEMRTQLGIPESGDSEYSRNETLRQRFSVLNVTKLRELAGSGVTIGAHTLSHPMLSQMPEGVAMVEIVESRALLEAALGVKVWAFAYPFGDPKSVGLRELSLAQRAGFDCAFVNTELGHRDSPFAVPRIHVSSRTTVAELEAHVSGFYRRMRMAAQ